MLSLKACYSGGFVHNVSSLRLFLKEVTYFHHYNSSINQIIKSFPIVGAIITNNRTNYICKDKDGIYNKETREFYSRTLSMHCGYGEYNANREWKENNCVNKVSCIGKIINFLNHFISFPSEINMSKAEAMAQLENNAQTADNLIQEIYSKLAVLQNCNSAFGPEAQKLIQENDALKQEVQKWKDLLILQKIKNGGNPVVRDPRLLERSAVVAATDTTVKQEAQSKIEEKPQQAEVKSESAPPQQSGKSGKKAKTKGGDEKPPAPGGAQKGAGKKTGGDQASATESQGNEEVDIGRLDLRIGLIKECTRHPDADSLYVEKIDCGEPNLRTVISGLVKHVPIEAMQNRMVVVLCNLKPSKMRGIMSEAMVMCASSPDKVEILTPPPGSAPGDVIEVEGFTRRPDAVMNPKKKIFETVAPDLKTNDSRQATYKGVPWTVPGKGFIAAESLVNVNVK